MEAAREPTASPTPVPAYNSSRDECISMSIRVIMMGMSIVTIVRTRENQSDTSLVAAVLEDEKSDI